MTNETHPLFAGFGNRAGRSMGGHHSRVSNTDEWLTPPKVVEALGGWESFDLDPASPVMRPWPTARNHLTIRDNGLLARWFGRVFLNPPYTTAVFAAFMARMVEHGCGTALIFARTETDAFFRYVWETASAALFVRGRYNFHRVDGSRAAKNSGAPSVLVAYGLRDADVLASCGIRGQFVPLRVPRIVALQMFDCGADATWFAIVFDLVAKRDGPVDVASLYREIAAHPKARGRAHVRAKIRQVMQRGEFERVGRGRYRRRA